MMGVRITDDDNVALYDSVTGTAFGPVFPDEDAAQDFLNFTRAEPDPRLWGDKTMASHYQRWVAVRGHMFGQELPDGTD